MEENTKRIFKNTIYLYIRQFIIMALSFFHDAHSLRKTWSIRLWNK